MCATLRTQSGAKSMSCNNRHKSGIPITGDCILDVLNIYLESVEHPSADPENHKCVYKMPNKSFCIHFYIYLIGKNRNFLPKVSTYKRLRIVEI